MKSMIFLKILFSSLCLLYSCICYGQINRFDQPPQNSPRYQPITYSEISNVLDKVEQKQAYNEKRVLKLIDEVCYLHSLTNDTLFQKRMVSLYNILKYWYEEVPLVTMDNNIKKIERSIQDAIIEYNERIKRKTK